MPAVWNVWHNRHGCGAARSEALHIAHFGDVHRVAAERDAERPAQAARHGDDAVGDAIMIRIGELHDETRTRLRGVDCVAGTERQVPHALELIGIHGDLEARRNAERVVRALPPRRGRTLAGDGEDRRETHPVTHDYLRPVAVVCNRSFPSGSTRISVGPKGTATFKLLSRPVSATVRRATAPAGP